MVNVAIWLSVAFALGLLMRQIGLPPLVGYLATGFILSINGFESNHILNEVAHSGVLLLLFSVGLKLRVQTLFRADIFATASLHMLLMVLFTFILTRVLAGIDTGTALLIAIALSFSSTVVAAKVLESKRELRAFHGRIAIGILIVQDLIAVAVLSIGNGAIPSPWAFLLFGLLLLRPVLFRILDISGHGELVVLYGLLLALVIGGANFEYFGLSSELGALILGVMLSGHKRSIELSNSIWSLKEILLVGFFLQIGLMGHPDLETVGYAFLFNLILPVKALLFFFILLLFKLRARSSFLASLGLATYSEFGLIVASLAVTQGWLSSEWMVLLATTVAISFAIAAPLNRYAHEIYEGLESFLQRFETSRRHPDDEPVNIGNSHIMIMGMGRIGTGAYDVLCQQQHRVIGLDSDPVKVEKHLKQGRRVLYADAEDPGLWANLKLQGVHTVLLAMPEITAKVLAAKQLRKLGFSGRIATTVVFDEEIKQLESAGADFIYNYYDGVGAGFAQHSLAYRNEAVSQ